MKRYRRAPVRWGLAAPFGEFIGEEDVRIANLNGRVHQASIGRRMSANLLGAKGALVEINRFRGPLDYQVWCHGMHTFRNRLHCWRHINPFEGDFSEAKNYTLSASSQLPP